MKKCIILLLCLTGCAARQPANYNDILEKWIGKTQVQLFQVWGEPEKVYALNSETYLAIYQKNSNRPFFGLKHPYINELNYKAASGTRYGLSSWPAVYYCQTQFTIQSGIVTDFAFSGDDCL